MAIDDAAQGRALNLSLAIAVVIGAVAIVWGLASDSRIILFDGIYTLFGTALSGMSILAAAVARRPATERFPFGLESAIPVVIVIQGAALLGTLAYAVVDSVALILDGGSGAAPGSVVAYGLLTLVASLVAAVVLKRMAPRSDLVVAEVASWRAGAVLSAVVAVGAGVGLMIERSSYASVVGYVDPVLVIVASMVLLPVPMRLIRDGGREILEASPPPAIRTAVEDAADRAAEEFGLGERRVRATKLGRRLYVEVDYLVEPGEWDVSDEDRVRRAVTSRLSPLDLEVWAAVELTTDPLE